jgi:hypothetical protein
LSVYAGDPSCGGAAEAALEGSRGWGSLLQVRLDDRPGAAAAGTASAHGHAEQPRRLPDVAATEVGKRDAEQQDLRRAEGAEPAGRSDDGAPTIEVQKVPDPGDVNQLQAEGDPAAVNYRHAGETGPNTYQPIGPAQFSWLELRTET